MGLGRNDEALQMLRAAERHDPLSMLVRWHLGMALLSARRYDDVIATCQKLPVDQNRAKQCLGRAQLALGRFDDAIVILKQQTDLATNAQARGVLGYALARTGHRPEAETMAVDAAFPNEQALIFAGLGDKEHTLDALGRMAPWGPQRIGIYLNDPEFAFLRGDPRVRELRRTVGLPVN